MSLKELQKRIEEEYPHPIRLERTKKVRRESLHDFLIKFFTEWNDEKDTIYADSREVQTPAEKRRSLGDIFTLCKYYYPDITVRDVIRELYIELEESINPGFRTSYCHQIHKRVWYYDPDQSNGAYNQDSEDEYGNTYKYYLDGRRI